MTDYKPGQIAMVTAANRREEFRAFFDGKTWRELSSHSFCVDGPPTVRPLVVLDLSMPLEYASALKGLAEIGDDNEARGWAMDARRLARLIEAQTRPDIEEPKGLGAVVEDKDGDLWVRIYDEPEPWRWGASRESWSRLKDDAVRILSPGVEP